MQSLWEGSWQGSPNGPCRLGVLEKRRAISCWQRGPFFMRTWFLNVHVGGKSLNVFEAQRQRTKGTGTTEQRGYRKREQMWTSWTHHLQLKNACLSGARAPVPKPERALSQSMSRWVPEDSGGTGRVPSPRGSECSSLGKDTWKTPKCLKVSTPQITHGSKKESRWNRKYFEINDNENVTSSNLWEELYLEGT